MSTPSKKRTFSYTILRYVHDAATGEFANLGILLFMQDEMHVYSKFRTSTGRVVSFFPGVKANSLRRQINNLRHAAESLTANSNMLQLANISDVLDISRRILPTDDSSLQWSPASSGITADPEKTTNQLFERFVLKHDEHKGRDRFTENEIWSSFRKNLPTKELLSHFVSKTISAKDDEVEFQHAWKNGIWHCLAPLSFDLSSPERIKDKAHKWLGQIASVNSAHEKFKIYFLLAKPQEENLMKAYEGACRILKKIPVDVEMVEENQFESFGKQLSHEIETHNQSVH